MEGKNSFLSQKFSLKTFIDVSICGENRVYVLSSDSILCILNKSRVLEKWMDLKMTNTFTLEVSTDYIFSGGADGIIRIFNTSKLEHLRTMPKPPALGSYNKEKGGNSDAINNGNFLTTFFSLLRYL